MTAPQISQQQLKNNQRESKKKDNNGAKGFISPEEMEAIPIPFPVTAPFSLFGVTDCYASS